MNSFYEGGIRGRSTLNNTNKPSLTPTFDKVQFEFWSNSGILNFRMMMLGMNVYLDRITANALCKQAGLKPKF